MAKYKTLLICFSIYAILSCCTIKSDENNFKYDLNSPQTTLTLPDTLKEISGLTMIDSSSIACIQDENGILFIYDVLQNKIKRQFTFNKDGDYEELARVGKAMYILRSDGEIYKLADYTIDNSTLTSYSTAIPANDNEGLCYDKENNRLLIGAKGKIDDTKKNKDKRVIYEFHLQSNKLEEKPVLKFDTDKIEKYLSEKNITPPTFEKNGKIILNPKLKFMTSAICIHPITNQLYLISAMDHLLFIFNPDGSMAHVEVLDPKIFNKAEGITFFENGDMLISNEGQNKKPTLLKFSYK